MKSERRHELQKNELADWLNKAIDDVRPYSKAILGVVIVLAAGAFAYSFVNGQRARQTSEGWREYFAASVARDTDALRAVASNFAGSQAGMWAIQAAADLELAQGSNQLYRDREGAEGVLEKAQRDYLKVAAEATDPMLQQRALFGLAQSYETLNDLDEAKKRYQQLVERWPNATLVKTAKERLRYLSEPSTKDFYAWFFKQKPPLAVSSPPGTQTRSASREPLIYDDLPSDPDLTLPDSLDFDLPPVNPPGDDLFRNPGTDNSNVPPAAENSSDAPPPTDAEPITEDDAPAANDVPAENDDPEKDASATSPAVPDENAGSESAESDAVQENPQADAGRNESDLEVGPPASEAEPTVVDENSP